MGRLLQEMTLRRGMWVFFAGVVFASHAEAKSILVIGDSQSCGPFGTQFVQELKESGGHRVELYGHWGASATTWMTEGKKAPVFRHINSLGGTSVLRKNVPAPTLEQLINRTRPDAVIVQLGGNLVDQNPGEARSSIRQVMRKIIASGAECFWIGPSNGRRPLAEFRRLYAILFEVARDEHCRLVDSRPLTSYPQGRGDGLHYQFLGREGDKLAEKWVRGVWSQIKHSLNPGDFLKQPGILTVPADKTSVYQGSNQKWIYPAPSSQPTSDSKFERQGLGR